MAKSTKEILAALGIGGLAATQSEDSEAVFLGRKAPGADPKALKRATKLEQMGWTPPEIFRQTGWTRGIGRDKEWRYEVSDKDMSLDYDHKTGSYTMNHPELAKHEPNALNVPIVHEDMPPGERGSYDIVGDKIALSPIRHKKNETALHEVQHSLQRRYGFAQGANPKESNARFADFLNGLESENRNDALNVLFNDKDLTASYDKADSAGQYKIIDKIVRNSPRLSKTQNELNLWRALGADAPSRYVKSAGEIEARDVSDRYFREMNGVDPGFLATHKTPKPGVPPIVSTAAEWHPELKFQLPGDKGAMSANDISGFNRRAARKGMPSWEELSKDKNPFSQKLGEIASMASLPIVGELFPGLSRALKEKGDDPRNTKSDALAILADLLPFGLSMSADAASQATRY